MLAHLKILYLGWGIVVVWEQDGKMPYFFAPFPFHFGAWIAGARCIWVLSPRGGSGPEGRKWVWPRRPSPGPTYSLPTSSSSPFYNHFRFVRPLLQQNHHHYYCHPHSSSSSRFPVLTILYHFHHNVCFIITIIINIIIIINVIVFFITTIISYYIIYWSKSDKCRIVITKKWFFAIWNIAIMVW